MNTYKLIPVFLALLGSMAASAQVADGDAPVSLRWQVVPVQGKFSTRLLDAGAHRTTLGLHVEAGTWHVDLALPEVASPTPLGLAGTRRGFRADPGDFSLGIGRSLGSLGRDASLWDLSRFSLVANAGHTVGQALDERYRNLWAGSLGAAWKFSQASSLGLNYRIETSSLPEAQASRSVGLSYGYQFSSGLRLNTSLDRGLTDGAPRWGGGLSISYTR